MPLGSSPRSGWLPSMEDPARGSPPAVRAPAPSAHLGHTPAWAEPLTASLARAVKGTLKPPVWPGESFHTPVWLWKSQRSLKTEKIQGWWPPPCPHSTHCVAHSKPRQTWRPPVRSRPLCRQHRHRVAEPELPGDPRQKLTGVGSPAGSTHCRAGERHCWPSRCGGHVPRSPLHHGGQERSPGGPREPAASVGRADPFASYPNCAPSLNSF